VAASVAAMLASTDPIFSANDTIDYHEKQVASNGGAEAAGGFARLFLVERRRP
jgi:hypothetical protein